MFARCSWQQAYDAFLRCAIALCALAALPAFADAPSFTGNAVLASGPSTIVNLRGQGVITGSAPMNVQINAVRVGGILSPLISVLRAVLQPGVDTSVCLQVQNLLGLDLTFLGVEMDVTAFNPDAPAGVSARVVVQTGLGGEDVSPLACADAVVLPPTANAGADQSVADTDGQPGETVALNGSASGDPDGTIASYDWRNAANQQIATGPTPSVRLPDGAHTITLIVTDNSGATASDTLNVNVTAPAANRLPNAVAGADRIIADTDAQAGENVTLDATQSSDPDGTIASYVWLLGQSTVVAVGATAQVRLPDGPQAITLRVTDNAGGIATDSVTITVAGANPQVGPRANAGADRAVADSDNLPGENVVLDGSASTDADGTISTYQWRLGEQVLATGATATVRLPDGESFVTLIVTDDDGNTASDGVLVAVAAQLPPVANAGSDQSITDSDALPGENVTFNGSASTDVDGVIVSYQWTLAGQPLASGATANVRLSDGNNLVTLTVVDDDGNSATDTVQITVAAAVNIPILSVLPGLTPNQMSVAVAMDSLCPRLDGLARQRALAADQADLQARCDAIRFGSSVTEQVAALDEISPQDLNATRTQTLNLSRTQLANVANRLVALRGGARGLSLVGLNLQIDGKPVPLQQLGSLAQVMRGGGASADQSGADQADSRNNRRDETSPDDLLGKKFGVWLRGNYSFGNKDASVADHGFDADQWGVVAGVDYRFSPRSVAGLALGYGQSNVSFNPVGAGRLDTRAVTAALYATVYSSKGFYVDAMANYLSSDYDSQRHIAFTEGGSLVDVTANGATQGATAGVAFTLGYDLNFGAFTIAPSMGYNYLSSTVDRFREHGAAGLDLLYRKQNYSSGTANAGLRLTYAWKTHVAVVVPQIRGEYLREFIDDTEAFGLRFANDPFDDTPVIIVHTDQTDQSYWRIAAGVSAQFRHGISGFVEYQKLQSLQYLDYADVALGVRFEIAFR